VKACLCMSLCDSLNIYNTRNISKKNTIEKNMGGRNACRVLVRKLEGKKTSTQLGRRYQDGF
jgi:hypothetical protein